MKNLNRNEMNAVMGGGGGKVGEFAGKVGSCGGGGTTTPKPAEKSWWEKAWDTIKSWF